MNGLANGADLFDRLENVQINECIGNKMEKYN